MFKLFQDVDLIFFDPDSLLLKEHERVEIVKSVFFNIGFSYDDGNRVGV